VIDDQRWLKWPSSLLLVDSLACKVAAKLAVQHWVTERCAPSVRATVLDLLGASSDASDPIAGDQRSLPVYLAYTLQRTNSAMSCDSHAAILVLRAAMMLTVSGTEAAQLAPASSNRVADVETGIRLIEAERWPEALGVFADAVRESPTDALALQCLHAASLRQGDYRLMYISGVSLANLLEQSGQNPRVVTQCLAELHATLSAIPVPGAACLHRVNEAVKELLIQSVNAGFDTTMRDTHTHQPRMQSDPEPDA
jgi:hypothetical protein